MMTNRLVFFMTVLFLVAIASLFVLNLTDIFSKNNNQTYLKHNDIQGMAVKYKGLLYTLNFEQQTRIIDLLNQSLKVESITDGDRQRLTIERIVIYPFNGPVIELKPIGFIDHELVYSAQEWNPNGFMREVSNGELEKILSETYDP